MDTVADMLTIIRNAQAVRKESVKAPYSKVNFGIAETLKTEGWIKSVELKKRGEKSWIILELIYDANKEPGITDIQRVSKLGKRVYVKFNAIPRVRQGYGVAIISTPKGIMTGKEAKRQGVGGEVLCVVY